MTLTTEKPLAVRGLTDFSVTILDAAQQAKQDALAMAMTVQTVTTETEKADAIACASLMKSLTKAMESIRVEVKAPILAAGREVDDVAKLYSATLEKETKRVEGLAAAYQAEQLRKAAAIRAEEERKQREAQAAVEAERERERLLRLAEERKFEEQRLADLAKIQAAKDDAAREQAQREADEAAERRAREVAAEQQAMREREEARLEELRQQAMQLQSLAAPKATGATMRVQMDYEVTDIRALFIARPDLVTIGPKRSMVLAAINIPNAPAIPGLRTFQTTKLNAKA